MSHLKERKEKTCLNCHTSPLYGRYCHSCGQENLEPKETVWHLVDHFFKDVTHFDGKFFSSVKYLLKKPGFLSTEYVLGRRASYLNPIRMYVFTSAIFFLILFTLNASNMKNVNFSVAQRGKSIDSLEKEVGQTKGPTVIVKNLTTWHPDDYKSLKTYDSVQANLTDKLRDGWFKKLMMRRLVVANEEYTHDSRSYGEHFLENLFHSFPKILFVSLPFFALILRLLYVRRSKQWLYVDHGIFTIHLYCATFILLLADILLAELSNRLDWPWLQTLCTVLIFAIVLYMFIYLFIAMRAFYRQGWWKTLLKFMLLGTLALVVNAILLMIFVLLSAISI